ncbi:ABC transporter family substrate-binding protein [Rothia sp. LK2588]|uniref:ABC transporter family substrate-binding protein n=1 Tax=Rothia sp. LK2588 TaxID=3114369 RepID=UPI0034CFFFAA
MPNITFNRRTLFATTAALGGTGLLAACGGGNGGNSGGASNAESASALGVGEDIAKLISVNPKERSELKEGGELRIPMRSIGPDFNTGSQSGNTYDNAVLIAAVAPLSVAGLWLSDFEGNKKPNPDFCESFEDTEEGGKQVLKIKLNPQAKFNDGTPVDIETLRATWEILGKGLDRGFDLVDPGPHELIESIEEDGDKFTVKVTMKTPYQPASDIFGGEFGVYHPAMNDKKVFNEGFVNKPHPEWYAGPFKLDSWDSSQKVFTISPNDKWWGEKPLLERIVFRQMEDSAQRAAFKNGEIDAIEARTLSIYKDVENTEGTEVRRGQRLFSGGMNMSSFRLPVEMRRAIFAAIDRKALAQIRFNGLNWSEELPGSVMLMPFSEYYEDNFAKATEGWDAGKILEEAGYTKEGDYYTKGGKNAKFAITTFGDDPVNAAMAQTLIQQMKAVGIECTIDNQPDANFGTVVGNKEFDMTFSGYTVGPDATTVAKQYYLTANNDGTGSPKIDEMISKISTIKDDQERNKKANEIEVAHMKEFASMGTVFNGPEIFVVKKELANYGAAIFGNFAQNPAAWANVGWTK